MNSSRIVLLIVAFCLFAFSNAAEKKKANSEKVDPSASCELVLNETADLLEPAMLVNRKTWPLTLDEVNKHCELGNKVYKNIRRYGKCLTGVSRQAVTIFLRGLKKFMQNICLSTKKKLETVEIMKCASNETVPGWTKCLTTANQKLDFTASNASDPAMVGNICCAYSELIDCVAAHTGTLDECKTRKINTSNFLKSSLQLIVKDLTELLCGNYETKEACIAHNAGRAEALAVLADGKYKVNGAFLLSPLVKATKNLGEIHADDI